MRTNNSSSQSTSFLKTGRFPQGQTLTMQVDRECLDCDSLNLCFLHARYYLETNAFRV